MGSFFGQDEHSLFCASDCSLFGFDLRRPEVLLHEVNRNKILAVSHNNAPPLMVWLTDVQARSTMVDIAEDEIDHIVMSPDGTQLAMADDSGVVQVYDVMAGGEVALRPSLHHQSHQNICTSVCFLTGDNGSCLASGGLDATVRLVDLSRPETDTHILFESQGAQTQVTNPPLVHRVAAHPAKPRLAAALGNGAVAVLDVHEGGLRLWAMLEEGHATSASQAVWLTGGSQLVSGGNDERIVLWDLPAGDSHIYEHGSKVNWLAASTEGLLVADQGSRVHLIDPARL